MRSFSFNMGPLWPCSSSSPFPHLMVTKCLCESVFKSTSCPPTRDQISGNSISIFIPLRSHIWFVVHGSAHPCSCPCIFHSSSSFLLLLLFETHCSRESWHRWRTKSERRHFSWCTVHGISNFRRTKETRDAARRVVGASPANDTCLENEAGRRVWLLFMWTSGGEEMKVSFCSSVVHLFGVQLGRLLFSASHNGWVGGWRMWTERDDECRETVRGFKRRVLYFLSSPPLNNTLPWAGR